APPAGYPGPGPAPGPGMPPPPGVCLPPPCPPPAPPCCPPPCTDNAFAVPQPSIDNAFQEDDLPALHGPASCFWNSCRWYLAPGTEGLLRLHPKHTLIAVLDPFIRGDTGAQPPAGSPTALDLKDISPNMAFGVRATAGYQWTGGALEVTGFYIPE